MAVHKVETSMPLWDTSQGILQPPKSRSGANYNCNIILSLLSGSPLWLLIMFSFYELATE